MLYRKANEGDLDALMAFWGTVGFSTSEELTETMVGEGALILATVGGEIAGTVAVRGERISQLAVADRYRGRGIAHELIRRAVEKGGTYTHVRLDNPKLGQIMANAGFHPSDELYEHQKAGTCLVYTYRPEASPWETPARG